MKKIAIIATVLMLCSCTGDFLHTKTESSFTADVVFSSPTLTNSAIMGIYEAINNNSFNGRLWAQHGFNNDVEKHISSLAGVGDTRGDDDYGTAVYKYSEAYDYYGTAYSGAMQAVERANICIDGLRQYADLDDHKMAYLLGEALFLRSWVYYELIELWGNIPYRFEPVTEETLYIGRTDKDEHFKQMLADLHEASELMPWAGASEMTTSILRPNRAAAKALRARIALVAGGYNYHLYGEVAVPMLSTDPQLTREITYGIARDECADLIENEGHGYILEPNFEKIFHDNCALVTTAGGEVFWELPFDYNNRGNNMIGLGVYHVGAGGSGNPTDDSDPFTTTYTGGRMGIVPTVYYDFDVADTRRDVSIVPFRWANGLVELSRPSLMTCGKLRAEWVDLSRGRITSNSNDGIPPIIVRYGDVLLMFAEAENELNGPTPLAQEALRRIRERAFVTSQAAYVASVSVSKEDFFEAIVTERKFELVGEMTRKYDLKRWGRLKSAQDQAKADMYELRNLAGKYTDVPAYVFWKPKTSVPNEREIVWYGMNRGEIAPGTEGQRVVNQSALTAWQSAGGWINYSTSGRRATPPVTPTLWITNSTTSGFLYDTWIEAQYYFDPDRRYEMPLPASVIMNSQGALNNASLGYGN